MITKKTKLPRPCSHVKCNVESKVVVPMKIGKAKLEIHFCEEHAVQYEKPKRGAS